MKRSDRSPVDPLSGVPVDTDSLKISRCGDTSLVFCDDFEQARAVRLNHEKIVGGDAQIYIGEKSYYRTKANRGSGR